MSQETTEQRFDKKFPGNSYHTLITKFQAMSFFKAEHAAELQAHTDRFVEEQKVHDELIVKPFIKQELVNLKSRIVEKLEKQIAEKTYDEYGKGFNQALDTSIQIVKNTT